MASPAYRDRSTGLAVFGVVQILLGILCILLLLYVASRATGGGGTRAFASALAVYGIGAVYFLVVGIGSMRARRWAHALSHAVSGLWLFGGIAAIAFAAVIGRESIDGRRAVLAAVFVAIPLAMYLFYRNRDVALTCDARDPKRRWTDHVPVSVLGLVLLLGFSAIAMLVSLSNPVLPLAGTVLTGPAAMIAMFALAALFTVIATQLYWLKESAWWMLLLLHVLGGIGAAMAPMRDSMLTGLMLAAWIAYLAFLVWLRRRYFARAT